jgi:hypothetical protein
MQSGTLLRNQVNRLIHHETEVKRLIQRGCRVVKDASHDAFESDDARPGVSLFINAREDASS